MLDFDSYLKRPKNEARERATAQPPVPANALHDIRNDLMQVRADIPREIDNLLSRLMTDLMPGADTGHYRKGWWDSIKNWWSNLWRGKYNPNTNPYYYQNRFGELGLRAEATEEYSLSLEEYRMLNDLYLQLEASTSSAPMIRLTSILNRWGQDVKRALDGHIASAIHKVDGMLRMSSYPAAAQPTEEGPPPEQPRPPEGPPEGPPKGPKEPAPEEGPPAEGPPEEGPPEGPEEPPAPEEGPPEEGPILGGLREPGTEKPAAGLHLPPEAAEAPERAAEKEEEPVHRASDGVSHADHSAIASHGGGAHDEFEDTEGEEEEEPEEVEFPQNYPEQKKGETRESFNKRLKDWTDRAWRFFKVRNKLNKKGQIKVKDFGLVSADDFYDMVKLKGEFMPPQPRPEEGGPPDAEPPDEGPPEEGPPAPAPEPATPPSGEQAELLKNKDAVRDVLHRLRSIPHERQSPEDQKILRAVWQPWYALRQKDKRHFNMRGNNGRRMRSNNPGKLPVVLPKVLRRGDPRVEILKTYYDDVFKALMHKGQIEREDDSEDVVRDRIEQLWQRSEGRVRKGKGVEAPPGANLTSRIESLADPTAVAELKKELAAGREREVRDILDALESGTEEKDLGPLQGHWPPTENESLVGYYRRLLREGGKAVVRSEFAKLPLSERYQYFKKLLASG